MSQQTLNLKTLRDAHGDVQEFKGEHERMRREVKRSRKVRGTAGDRKQTSEVRVHRMGPMAY